ncbi:hypothetical protein HF846_13865 [Clostridium cadaveris]|uniref:Uncharacterized protein n=1 Tax=Clostridium cadaveris TaxID=1529 RepID=A0A316MFX8_9CLOT|nr:hypothetical protein [Clostridium cadaveris]MDU4952961.1 hypothetical protein [Clostridium sp.]NME65682.1 hypothetical protein [Clostridium cadaveris]PWL55433.1 MAG: hypothetical protein DBY38_01560 [Clostridium cadaveris]
MQKIYTSIKCCRCKKEFVLVTEDYKSSNGYLVCPYCSSKNVKKENESDSVKECMKENAYKRKNGALRQVRRE